MCSKGMNNISLHGKRTTLWRWTGLLMLLCTFTTQAQISITSYHTPYYQNFNSLANTGTENTLVPYGWSFLEEGTTLNAYSANDGTNFSGGIFSFGSSGSTERALGSLNTGSIACYYGAYFINNTGGLITRLTIEYTGEHWSSGWYNRRDSLAFQYSTNASSLKTGEWNNFIDLNFVGGTFNFCGALNGNLPENSYFISATIENLSIAAGDVFWIRWKDIKVAWENDGLAIDDFSLSATDPCPISIDSFIPHSHR